MERLTPKHLVRPVCGWTTDKPYPYVCSFPVDNEGDRCSVHTPEALTIHANTVRYIKRDRRIGRQRAQDRKERTPRRFSMPELGLLHLWFDHRGGADAFARFKEEGGG